MKLALIFLADMAQVTPDGKFSVIGGDLVALSAPSFPAKHPIMGLVAKIEFMPEDMGRSHTFIVEMVDDHDVPTSVPVTATITPPNPRPELADLMPSTGLVVTFAAVTFPHQGKYIIRVKVRDEATGQDSIIGSTPLYLLQASASPQTIGMAETSPEG